MIDLKTAQPCICDNPSHNHIHCGECTLPISIDGIRRIGDCENKGIHKKIVMINNWCVCDDEHVKKLYAENTCECGVAKSHSHCLDCFKVVEEKEDY
jgi:hypothetical protein